MNKKSKETTVADMIMIKQRQEEYQKTVAPEVSELPWGTLLGKELEIVAARDGKQKLYLIRHQSTGRYFNECYEDREDARVMMEHLVEVAWHSELRYANDLLHGFHHKPNHVRRLPKLG